jgi:hypothetical protein
LTLLTLRSVEVLTAASFYMHISHLREMI